MAGDSSTPLAAFVTWPLSGAAHRLLTSDSTALSLGRRRLLTDLLLQRPACRMTHHLADRSPISVRP